MKNGVGVGIGFGARDLGLSKVATKVASAFGSVTGAVAGMNQSLSKGFGDLKGRISSALSALPENLTTGYEAELVAADKAGRAMAANMGYSSKVMGQFSSQAFALGRSLNLSTEEAGKAIFAWDKGADVLKAVGVDSAETAAKVQRVFGVDMSKFVFTLKEMGQTLGMDNAAIKRMTDSTLAWGQQSGDVSKALNGMQQQVDHLNKRAHAFGKTLSGDELADWATSANEAKQILFAVGNNAEQADAAVNSMQDQMLEAGKNMGKMFAGSADDLTNWQKELGVIGLDVQDQFKLMSGGPAGFIKGMANMVNKLDRTSPDFGEQMNFIKKRMEEAMGPEVADQIFNVFNKGGMAMDEMVKKLPKATEDLGKLAKSADRTGYTTARRMEMMREEFTASLRSSIKDTVGWVKEHGKWVKKKMNADEAFIGNSKKGLEEYGKKLKKLAATDGPMGQLAQGILNVQKFGAAGLVPAEFQGEFEVFKTLGKEFGPVLSGLGQMVPLLTMLASPVVLVAAAFAGLVFWFKSAQKEGDSFADTIRTMEMQAENFFLSLTDFLVEKFPKHARTIQVVMGVLSATFHAFGEVVAVMGTGIGVVFDMVEEGLRALDGNTLEFADTFRNIWKYEIVEPIKLYFADLWLSIKETAKSAFDWLSQAVTVAVDYWAQLFEGIVESVTAPFVAIDKWVGELFRNSISSDIEEDLKVALNFFDKFTDAASKGLATILSPLGLLPNATQQNRPLPPPQRPAPTVSADAREAALIGAIHRPQWYERYEQLFVQRMMALEAAVASSGGGAPVARGPGKPPPKLAGRGSKRFDLGLNGRLTTDTTGRPTEDD